MKYIDSEKLVAEIEKQMNECIGRFGVIHKLPEYRCLKNIHAYITSLQQEQPKFNIGDLVVSKKNPHLTYKILATNIPNELGKTDYKVEIFTDGKPGILNEPHNIHLISSDRIEDWGKLIQQEQLEMDLEKEYNTWWNSISGKINIEHMMEWYMHETARHFYEFARQKYEK